MGGPVGSKEVRRTYRTEPDGGPDTNKMEPISRRRFAQLISAAGTAGAALLETMHAEMQDSGAISRESVRSFLNISGTKVNDDQLVSLQTSLERALDSMKRIRERPVSRSREPAVMFRVRR